MQGLKDLSTLKLDDKTALLKLGSLNQWSKSQVNN